MHEADENWLIIGNGNHYEATGLTLFEMDIIINYVFLLNRLCRCSECDCHNESNRFINVVRD